MAVQEWTIITLVGPAADAAADRFQRWWKSRVADADDDGSFGFCFNEWSPSVRREASAFLADLVEHRWGMPIAYFSQHIDIWLTGAEAGIVGPTRGGPEPVVMHDAGQLWCRRVRDPSEVTKHWRSAAKRSHFAESQWLARRMIEAAEACKALWPEAVLLLNRQAISPSPSDDELKQAAAILPSWITPSLS